MPMTSMKLIHCVGFRFIFIDRFFFGSYPSKKMPVLFRLCYLKPKLSPCVLHFAHTSCDEVFACFYSLCLNPLTGGITKFCVTAIKYLLRRVEDVPEFTAWTNGFCFSSSTSLLFKMYCQVLVSRLHPLHSNRPQSTSIFLMLKKWPPNSPMFIVGKSFLC